MNMQTTRLDIIALERRKGRRRGRLLRGGVRLVETSLFVSDSLVRSALPAMLYIRTTSGSGEIVRAVFATDAVFYFPVARRRFCAATSQGVVFGGRYNAGGRRRPAGARLARVGDAGDPRPRCWCVTTQGRGSLLRGGAGREADHRLAFGGALGGRWGGCRGELAFAVQAACLWWRLAKAEVPEVGASLLSPLLACLVMAPALLLPSDFWLAAGLAVVAYGGGWWLLAHKLDPATVGRVKTIVRRWLANQCGCGSWPSLLRAQVGAAGAYAGAAQPLTSRMRSTRSPGFGGTTRGAHGGAHSAPGFILEEPGTDLAIVGRRRTLHGRVARSRSGP